MDDFSGAVVGNRYTIEREIGRGGMATVWLAIDQQHARKVAIKTLHAELAGAIGIDRFLREIRLTAQLQHPGIVPILDSGVLERRGDTPLPWYAMPYLDGESLRSRLNRELQLPIDESLRITEAVGTALEAAHQRGIVHRDIKPENVFLSGDHVYVVDFGIARALATTDADRLTSTGLAIGTPAYMSPEQSLGASVDARSDQYSLASVLYEMIAGEPPFSGPNAQATLARRMAEPARSLSTVRSTVPPAVERATLRALERTPADRFPSVAAFLTALRSTDASPAARVRPAAGQRRVLLSAGVGIVALGLALWLVNSLGAGRRPHVPDPEVVALYQRGVQAYDRRTAEGVVDAVATFKEVIRRDSLYAAPYNALAKAYVRAHQRGFRVPGIQREQLLRLAIPAVARSLSLDSMSADAWTTHALVSHQVDPTNLAPTLRSIRLSIGLDSMQPTAWLPYANMLAENGDLTGAMEAWRRSVRLGPSYSQGLAFMALGHYWRGNYDSATVWADSAVGVDGNYLLARHTSTLVAIERGRFEEAEAQAEAAVRLSDEVEVVNSRANQALVKARAGNRALAMAHLLAAEVMAGSYEPTPHHTALNLAEVHAALGDINAALRALGRYAYPKDKHFQLHLRCSPTFAPMERDSTFRAMLVIPRPAPGQHC